MFTPDSFLPASALFSAASILPRLSWLNEMVPERVTGRTGPDTETSAPLDDASDPFFEHAADVAINKTAAVAAVARDFLVPVMPVRSFPELGEKMRAVRKEPWIWAPWPCRSRRHDQGGLGVCPAGRQC